MSPTVRPRADDPSMTTSTITSRTTAAPSSSVATESTCRRHRSPVADHLDRRWERLRARPSTRRRVQGWVADDCPSGRALARCRTLDDVVELTHHRHGAAADELFAALVEVAVDDEIAQLVVLRRLLPALVTLARRWEPLGDDDSMVDHAIAAAWIAIRQSSGTPGPTRHLAARLVSAAIWSACRKQRRKLRYEVIPTDSRPLLDREGPDREVDALVAVATVLHVAGELGADSSHVSLLRHIVAGSRTTDLAEEFGVTPNSSPHGHGPYSFPHHGRYSK